MWVPLVAYPETHLCQLRLSSCQNQKMYFPPLSLVPFRTAAVILLLSAGKYRYLHTQLQYLHFPSLFAFHLFLGHELISDNWGAKAKRRKTTGTGRMRYLKTVARRFNNGFRNPPLPQNSSRVLILESGVAAKVGGNTASTAQE
jgi:hypothetical protein